MVDVWKEMKDGLNVTMPLNGSDYELTASSTAARTSKAVEGKKATLYCPSADLKIKVGGSSVTAGTSDYDFFLPSGPMKTIDLGNDVNTRYISAIRASGTGDVQLYINDEKYNGG